MAKVTRRLTRFGYAAVIKKIDRSGQTNGLSLFLDFDGTLTPLAGHPDDACLMKGVRETLLALKEQYPLAIISGRALSDLKEKISIQGIVYIGNHGMEISAPDFSLLYDIGSDETREMNVVAGLLGKLVAAYDGTVLESKGLTLSIHHRLVGATEIKGFLTEVYVLLKPIVLRGLIKITTGKGLVEIRPTADWDKGSALGWVMQRKGFKGTVPICIGDDETDEDAFRVIKGRGVSVFVGKRSNSADFCFAHQGEVEPFLAFLADSGRST